MWNCWAFARDASGFNDFAAAQAGSAYPNALPYALYLGVNWTQVDVPAAPADVVRVADRIPKLRPFAANITNMCHNCSR
jgi:hypothetical protein